MPETKSGQQWRKLLKALLRSMFYEPSVLNQYYYRSIVYVASAWSHGVAPMFFFFGITCTAVLIRRFQGL